MNKPLMPQKLLRQNPYMFMCVHGLQELASTVVRGLSRGNSVKRGHAGFDEFCSYGLSQ
jgi:hypothetical protein